MSWISPVNAECSSTNGYLKLINLVKKYPILYKNTTEIIFDSFNFRKNQRESNQRWLEVASDLAISVGECRRRWKTLKETFLRIQKRNLKKLSPTHKKWVYEDAMSFLKNCEKKKQDSKYLIQTAVPTTQIENQGVNLVEMDTNAVQIESQEEHMNDGTVEYLELDIDSIDNSEYYIVDNLPPEKHSGDNVIEITSPVQTSLLKSNHNVIMNDKAVPKYIISTSDLMKNDFANASVINVNDLNSENGFIVTSPIICKEELSKSVVFKNPKRPTIDISQNGKTKIKNVSSRSNIKKKTKRINELLKLQGNINCIETFFENMAQNVLKLPTQAQAEVKMEICKIVTMAEIKLSSMQNSKT